MRHPRFHIFEQTPDSLGSRLAEAGMPRYRANQVLAWVYDKSTIDPTRMTNLSRADRDSLASLVTFNSGSIEMVRNAGDGTEKLLIRWCDGESRQLETSPGVRPAATALKQLDYGPGRGRIPRPADGARPLETECVMIPSENRRTACISSQVGCPVGCRFCASGIGGLDGNLSAGRIVEQVWQLNDRLARQGERISNVVFMGLGEPLANYDSVLQAVRILIAPWAFNLSARRITISTVGLPAAIRRLADEKLALTLAISLHAPNDELRRQLIPWAQYTSIADLLDAGRFYFERTGREVTLEYILLGGCNDQPVQARQLADIASTLRANVNLIRYNEVADLPFERPLEADVRRFQTVLRQRRINTHIRASRGRDIAAACGQLRHESQAVSIEPPTSTRR